MHRKLGSKPIKRGWMRWYPDYMVSRVTDVTPQMLDAHHFRGVLLDIDNTIIPWQGMDISDDIRKWVKSVMDLGVQICLVSNTNRPKRLRKLAQTLGVLHVPNAAKPRRRGLQQALDLMDVSCDHAVMIGDQMFTDVWAGNRMRMTTILVEPIANREFVGTKISRAMEKILMWRYRRNGMWPINRNMMDSSESQIE